VPVEPNRCLSFLQDRPVATLGSPRIALGDESQNLALRATKVGRRAALPTRRPANPLDADLEPDQELHENRQT
jgi:hypothetical protein